MTTFTKLSNGEKPSVSVYPSHKLSKINDNIYGGFTEVWVFHQAEMQS